MLRCVAANAMSGDIRSMLELPAGVQLRNLTVHADERGALAEVYREQWGVGERPVQWNTVRSRANVLRGVHVHPAHADYLLVADGRMLLGLHDIRADSPTRGLGMLLELDGARLQTVYVPPGVAHGFYFSVPTLYFYALSHPWDLADELGCRWDDPGLGLVWPTREPVLSARDRTAGSYAEMVAAWHAATRTTAPA
jgi:dTDP-4-dehydrorhamnose 3,5-epimerase